MTGQRMRAQSAEATARTSGEVDAGELLEESAPIVGQLGRGVRFGSEEDRGDQADGGAETRLHGLEQAACDLELRGGVARGEQAVVANLHEA